MPSIYSTFATYGQEATLPTTFILSGFSDVCRNIVTHNFFDVGGHRDRLADSVIEQHVETIDFISPWNALLSSHLRNAQRSGFIRANDSILDIPLSNFFLSYTFGSICTSECIAAV